MSKKLLEFASQIGLPLTELQAQTLVHYAQLVWQKKTLLNLTSVADLEEILTRHICDGLQGAATISRLARPAQRTWLDAGSGAGYIGLTAAAVLPDWQVTLVESLEKRCAFLNWVVLSLGLKNVTVKQLRLGEDKTLQTDVVSERAMGQLPDIIGICTGAVKAGGFFLAYQGENSLAGDVPAGKYGVALLRQMPYRLPDDPKTRQLVLFQKSDA